MLNNFRTAIYWNQKRKTQNWWDVPELWGYFQQSISGGVGGGVVQLVREGLNGAVAASAISIGAGAGEKEQALLQAELVETFDLFDLSKNRVDAANAKASASGMSDRMCAYQADGLKQLENRKYDLVYWDHSLHHMYDVLGALKLSVSALNPGGLLVVNDYVGPNRLNWTAADIDYLERRVIEDFSDIRPFVNLLPRKTPVHKLVMRLVDPSEAPQSELIEDGFREVTGSELKPAGGLVLYTLAAKLARSELLSPAVIESLISLDKLANSEGRYYLASGYWRNAASD